MAQPADDAKSQEDRRATWPKSLLLNEAYAATFQCVKCNQIPLSCMNDEIGDVLCSECAKNIDNVTVNKGIQKMINNLNTKCPTTHPKNLNNDDLIASHCSRYRFAQPVCGVNHKSNLPDQEPFPGLFTIDTSAYYPEDRGMSESIDYGRNLAKKILKKE